MRFKILIVILIVITFFTSSCTKPKTETAINPVPDRNITTTDEFHAVLKNWTDRLMVMAVSTSKAYDSWTAGQINREEFIVKTQQIYEQMKQLKKQSDLKEEFKLSEIDKKQVNYDSMLNAYNNAKKDLNDFLFLVPQLEDDQIKSIYNNKVKENFNENVTELKNQLTPQDHVKVTADN